MSPSIQLEGVDALGLDEAVFTGADGWRDIQYLTGMSTSPGARLLDVVRRVVGKPFWRNGSGRAAALGVQTSAFDRWTRSGVPSSRGCAAAVRGSGVGRCKVTRLRFAAVDDVPRECTQRANGHSGRAGNPP
jgi:hypothetical protein